MKKLLIVFLAGLLILSTLPFSVMANDDITIIINGEKLISDVPAKALPTYDYNGNYIGDRTMLPVRAISEKLNFDVAWDETTSGITLYRNNQLVIMWLNADSAFKMNGIGIEKVYEMDAVPQIIENRTLVPVRAVAELLGAEVTWIGETRTVDIKYNLGQIEENKGYAEQCLIYGRLLLNHYDSYYKLLKGTLEGVKGKIVLDNGKEMEFKVYPEIAPLTAGNFINLSKEGFYKNTTFHRVIKEFVAQGGGYDVSGSHKDAPSVTGEFVMNGIFNLLSHKRGVISLARPSDPNMGSSEFFICHQDTPSLDGSYAAFGEITSGFDVLDEICNSQTDSNDKPLTDIVVKDIIIYE